MANYEIPSLSGDYISILRPTDRYLNPDLYEMKSRFNCLSFHGWEEIFTEYAVESDKTDLSLSTEIFLNYPIDDINEKEIEDDFTFLGYPITINVKNLDYDTTDFSLSILLSPMLEGYSNKIENIYDAKKLTKITYTNKILPILIVKKDSLEKYYIFDRILSNKSWYKFSLTFLKDKLNVSLNDLNIKTFIEINSEDFDTYTFETLPNQEISTFSEITSGDLQNKKLEIIWNKNIYCLVDSFKIESRGDLINQPFEYFEDYKYADFYSLRLCSSECPSAAKIEDNSEYGLPTDENFYLPRKKKINEFDKICSFSYGDKSPFYDELSTLGILGKKKINLSIDRDDLLLRNYYWQQLQTLAETEITKNLILKITDLNDNIIGIYDSPTSEIIIPGTISFSDGFFEFWLEKDITQFKLSINDQNIKTFDSSFENFTWTNLVATDISEMTVNKQPILKLREEYTNSGIAKTSSVCFFNTDGSHYCSECPKTYLIQANEEYPSKYSYDEYNKILSTHYKVEIDLNDEPFGDKYIINKDLAYSLYDGFEDNRPVSRVAHYHEKINFVTDFSGKPIPLYSYPYLANWISRYTKPIELNEGAEIILFNEETLGGRTSKWILKHDLLLTDFICQCFDENGKLLFPSKQYALDENTFCVEFSYPVYGSMIIEHPNYIQKTNTEDQKLQIKHQLTTLNEPNIVQFIKNDREEPAEIQSTENDSTLITLSQSLSGGKIYISRADKIFYQTEKKSIWTIEHNLGEFGIFIQAYDQDYNILYPEELTILDENTAQLIFSSEMSGFVGVRKIGNSTWKEDTMLSIVTSGYFLFGDLSDIELDKTYGKDFSKRTYSSEIYGERKIQSNKYIRSNIKEFWEDEANYYFVFELPEYEYDDFSINEIGLYDSTNQMCFYAIGETIFKPSVMTLTGKFIISKTKLTSYNNIVQLYKIL